MKTALAIFAKTPNLSPIKTRLAKTIGTQKAIDFYKLSIKAIEEMGIKAQKSSKDPISPYWILAEENGNLEKMWQTFPQIWTGDGSFGTRLSNIYNQLIKKHDFVILIGTDSPQIKADDIISAIEIAKRNKNASVIGASFDGGFYLFGSSKPIGKEIWENVPYSERNTLEKLTQKLTKNSDFPIEYIPTKTDVDTAEDLARLYADLRTLKQPTISQKNLIAWIRGNL